MAEPRIAALLAAIVAAALYLPAVGMLLRVTSPRHALTIFAGVAALLFSGVLALAGHSVSLWHLTAYFGAAVSLAVFLYGAVLKSLSLEMLAELSRSEGGLLSLEQLAERVVRPACATRAHLLVNMGAAVHDTDRYVITAQGQAAANRIEAIRRFLRLDSLGLYQS